MPGCVVVGAANRHPGQGYLPPDTGPAPVSDPRLGLQNTVPPKYLKEDDFKTRQRLITKFDASFKSKYESKEIEAYVDYYKEAVKLLKSPDLVAFDISREDESVRNTYGNHRIGQGCLLARRLIEKERPDLSKSNSVLGIITTTSTQPQTSPNARLNWIRHSRRSWMI